MPQQNNFDISAIIKVMQEAGQPYLAKLEQIDQRTRDLATKADLDRLRAEIVTSYVQRDVLEPRLVAMADHISRIERDLENVDASVDKKLEKNKENALSDKDRTWVRWGQVGGWVGLAVSLLAFAAQHIHFN